MVSDLLQVLRLEQEIRGIDAMGGSGGTPGGSGGTPV